jgi:hypothetical protein
MEISLQFYVPTGLHPEEKSTAPAGKEVVWVRDFLDVGVEFREFLYCGNL